MGVFDLFSKRRKRERGENADVYTYDNLPDKLKVQVVQIWGDAIGANGRRVNGRSGDTGFKFLVRTLRKEYGVFSLTGEGCYNSFDEFTQWFFDEKDVEKCLDAVELSCVVIDNLVRDGSWHPRPLTKPDDALAEINTRFREAGVGYQYESGKIVRVDSQLIHKEVVLPALSFLSEPGFKGANQEFLSAHEHYRSGKYEECLVDCLKAFESTMKVICHKRKWSYDQHDQARKLIEILFSNNLVPPYLQSQFTSLRSMLESGIPTIRNKDGGHGQGVQPRNIPDYLASYQLHQTAATILFLIKAEKGVGP